jgi:DNA-binding CsgD family transcriptional regulator
MMLWRVTTPVLHQILSSDSTIEDTALLTAVDALRQSIGIRLYIGAAAHEDTGLVRLALADKEHARRPMPAEATEDAVNHISLTAREQQVLAGAARALSNRNIARELGITETTVKRHLRNIFSKLGATSRVDAINKAGLVPARASLDRAKPKTIGPNGSSSGRASGSYEVADVDYRVTARVPGHTS